MLHQTFPLFLPKFNHFSSSSSSSSSSATTNHHFSSSSSPPTTTTTPTTSSSQVKPEMECVEAKALKTSCWPEMGLKSVQQVLSEELILVGNGITNCVHDSFVDDLLDFPKEEVEDDDKFIEEEEEEEEEEKDSVSVSSHEQNSNCSSDVTAKDEFGSIPGSELCVPADDLADLEWLSHFVEDSFTEFSFPYPSVTPTEKTQTQTPIPNTNTNPNRSQLPVCSGVPFPSPVPAKARSKRSRTNRGGRVWSLGSSPSFSESTITTTTTTSSSSYSSSPSSSSSNSCLIFTNPSSSSSSKNLDLFYYPPPSSKKQKKKKKKKKDETNTTQNQRRCSHCGVQKTPQWRTGPLGAKTLCNACGVRFKSGRLLPEYRPACSPTFSSEVHSNNHRKVLEMRRKKDSGVPDSCPLSPAAVHSF